MNLYNETKDTLERIEALKSQLLHKLHAALSEDVPAYIKDNDKLNQIFQARKVLLNRACGMDLINEDPEHEAAAKKLMHAGYFVKAPKHILEAVAREFSR